MHQKLFSHFDLAGRQLKNRVIATIPPTFLAGSHGQVTPELADYYERIAATDVAMIITEPAAVNSHRAFSLQLAGNENESVAGLSKIVERIRAHDCLPILHVSHPGINALPEAETGNVYGPSSLELARIKNPISELSYDQIRKVSNSFLETAISAWNSGFSGMEISGADGSLLQQFLSPITNRRTDDYGYVNNFGFKFITEIFKALRKAVPDLILSFRLSARDLLPKGKTIESSIKLASILEGSGANMIHVTSGFPIGRPDFDQPGNKNHPSAIFAEDSMMIKNEVQIPVLVSGKISTPEIAETILKAKQADLVGLGKTLNRDLDWIKTGRINSESIKVRTCLRCISCCAAKTGCPDFKSIQAWAINLNKYLKGKS